MIVQGRVLLCLLVLAACKREARELRTDPAVLAAMADFAVMPGGIGGRLPAADTALSHPYDSNAYQISQGKRLYAWFNCAGCHSDGGGGSGPGFLSGWWRYGPDPVSIVVSLRDGRPNGMPSFRDHLTTEQMWQLAGYLRSVGATTARAGVVRPQRRAAIAAGREPCAGDEGPSLRWAASMGGWQSALDPQGPQAASIGGLLLVFTVVAAAVWLLVMLVLGWAVWRRRPAMDAPASPDAATGRWPGRIVAAATALTTVVLIGLTVLSYRATASLTAAGDGALVIRVRGLQWWWEVTYPDERPQRVFATANEIHVPVGRPVRLQLEAVDVIHSFWVPNLAGKQDLIPGRVNQLSFVASRAGEYRGQCAEFCGLQHAHMALVIVAEAPEAFAAWRDRQTEAAQAPADEEQTAGRQVMERQACAGCHTVRGTRAAGTTGPDLTHVAGRSAIAAGVLPATRGSLAAWIADPQTVKPGSNMPMVMLSADELRAVSAYLAALR